MFGTQLAVRVFRLSVRKGKTTKVDFRENAYANKLKF